MHLVAKQFTTEILMGECPLDALCRISQLPVEVVSDAASKGAVWVSLQRGQGRTRPRRLRSALTPVKEGSSVMLNYNPGVLATQPQDMWCVSDQVNYGIWFKPAGMLCQGSKWSDHTTATEVAAGIRDKSCYLVHRLDRAACGLLVLAYTKNALRRLADMFAQRQITKTYSARVNGDFTLDLPMTLNSPIDDKSAITTIHGKLFDSENQSTTLRISIATGRKHQIRKHLASIGYPIVGDRLYEGKSTIHSQTINLQLVAQELNFKCPFTLEEVAVAIDSEKALIGELSV